MISKSKDVFVAVAALLAAFVLLRQGKEGWRPFAWYGNLTYQAGGDWSGVIPSTREVDPPIPVTPPVTCGARQPRTNVKGRLKKKKNRRMM